MRERSRIVLDRTLRLTLLSCGVTGALYLLLVQERLDLGSRALQALWDLAHVPLFFVLTVVYDYALTRKRARRVSNWLSLLWPPLLSMAVVTEVLQGYTAREASVRDALMNVVGVLLATLFLYGLRFANGKRRLAAWTLSTLSLLPLLWNPLLLSVADWQMRRDFPLLFNGERLADRTLWSRGSIDSGHPHDGEHALKLPLSTQPYSGSSLRHFPHDWRGHTRLKLAVFNPQAEALPLSLRVHDRAHDNGPQKHSDRYNRDFNAAPGWTELDIPLSHIEAAPTSRKLQLGEVSTLRIYYRGTPKQAYVVYVDGVRLE